METLDELSSHYRRIIELLGEDPSREGLLKTPMRVAKAMQVLTRGYEMDAHKVLTDALFREDYSQMVLVTAIRPLAIVFRHSLAATLVVTVRKPSAPVMPCASFSQARMSMCASTHPAGYAVLVTTAPTRKLMRR